MSSITVPADELQPVDWRTIEDAIYDWVTGELGTEISFLWENQNAPQPAYPYVSAVIETIVPEGGRKERRHQFDAAAAAGEEIELFVVGTFKFTLKLQTHVDADTGAYDRLRNAQALATRLQWSLHKDSTDAIFQAANLALVGELDQTDLSLVINEEWTSRASLDVSLRAVAVMSETTGYMDKVSGIGTTSEPTRSIPYTIDSTA
jgi:hypothetical protein